MNRRSALLIALILWIPAADGSAQQSVPFRGNRTATVMTWNVYHGVDVEIFNVLGATDPTDLALKVAAVYQAYGTTDFPGRAAAIAVEIDATQPELIGLQEVILVRTQSPADGPASPATDVAIDVLELILDALAARGLQYEAVVQSVGFDAELPSAFGFDVRHTNRDVILARSDLKTADLKLSNPMAATFETNCAIPTPLLGAVTTTRAWASVDAKIRGKSFRLISTHLESDCGAFTVPVRAAQAGEILAGPANSELPLLLIGDLNSRTDGSGFVYNGLRAIGFEDAWDRIGLGVGWTCCQWPNLLNGPSWFDRRLDVILSLGQWTALSAITVGDDPLTDKTQSGLWPSDHAGVVARMQLPHR